jgi:hypothetical protein
VTAQARLGAFALPLGAVVLALATALHPLGADPAEAPAAFAEYAADPHYVWTHLGQFAGFFGLGVGLVALAGTLEAGWAAAWGRAGALGAVAGVAVAAALQAVDGVALKAMVDRWAAAEGPARLMAFEAALALRQLEIGLAGLLSLLSGLCLLAFGLALLPGPRFPAWLGLLALLDGAAMLAAGAAQAATGFSDLAMTLSMAASAVFLLWALLVGLFMGRLRPRQSGG